MLIKIVKSTTVLALFISSLSAASFNAGAEKDRQEMIKFFEAKFEDPAKIKIDFLHISQKKNLNKNMIKI